MIDNFKTIERSSLVDKVEANLIGLLKQKKLKVGDSIPTELELVEKLNVSRTVIREALLRLRMMGLIESKKKKGSVITSPDLFSNMDKSMNPHILSDETLREIFEIRLVLEVGMADVLFHKITKKEVLDLLHDVEDFSLKGLVYDVANILTLGLALPQFNPGKTRGHLMDPEFTKN